MTRVTTPFTARATAAEVLAGVDLTGRRIIVTGGASGLGAETVRALAGAGARVTIATRDPSTAEAIMEEFPQTEAVALDLADLESVRAFCQAWDGPADAVIANAGVMMLPERRINALGWEMQLATNYLGHFALVTGLHEALRSAERGRVVVVSSGAQLLADFDFDDPQFERRAYDPVTAYAQSKTADVLLAVGISRRWAADGITANACAPGLAHTNLSRYLDAATLQMLGAQDTHGNRLTPPHFKTPEQAAATTTLLAASPLLEGVTGRYFEENQEAKVIQGDPGILAGGPDATTGFVAEWSLDPAAADRLWEHALTAISGTEPSPSGHHITAAPCWNGI
ncbi:NAD(P)-dependent dehydrogenase, short-chain alcohol dehydrogenase family [Streptomyces sp. DvalAA-14]|uniref:SDR family NAD(P)-dependent oxidoreductase n=1 Tax=unclassified Streptomyces TaxID=2593676 RepID=UPI00081B730A|nr:MULTISPECIES: SDR family NAD(P)-dependent oxidoreductase [unclassified Streptomyces]MYS24214.1 SDR family NAD(P)-dependent oxidoreductase [Streptomyces sp. SID4948]SCE43738.1 NAD(P)-dependent dehydrogenase, short-chain alcohol dehydrogenase family [Streptomyces sp. DvalAA-14]